MDLFESFCLIWASVQVLAEFQVLFEFFCFLLNISCGLSWDELKLWVVFWPRWHLEWVSSLLLACVSLETRLMIVEKLIDSFLKVKGKIRLKFEQYILLKLLRWKDVHWIMLEASYMDHVYKLWGQEGVAEEQVRKLFSMVIIDYIVWSIKSKVFCGEN